MGVLRITVVNQAFEKAFLTQASVEDAFGKRTRR